MSTYIVITLVPETATDGGAFANDLNGLQIEAFDLTSNSPTQGQSVGPAAVYIAPALPPPFTTSPLSYAGPPIFDPTTGIVQQFDQSTPPPPILFSPVAVAFALIQVTTPTPFENLRIVMTRNGESLPVPEEYYNVELYTGTPTPDQFQFIPVTSLYLSIPPAPLSGTGASVTLPSNGAPPAFDDVVQAMTTILGIDPGGTPPALASLSPAQCANLAMEILWSQPNPLPTPPEALENMYNQPPNTGVPGDQHEQNRQQFEGALNSYYSTTDANAQRLSNYVYAVAAAFQCQQISQGSPQPVTRALFELPVNAGQPSSGPLGEVQVLLVSTTAGGALPVSFGIPATYFYALGATLPPQVNAAQRYQLATGDLPARLLAQLTDAVNSGVIADAVSATELGFGVSPNINPAQAVRRLGALSPGNSTATPQCPMTPAVVTIVNDWLNFGLDWPDATAHTLDQFWSGEASAQATDYLEFVLDALTEGYAPSPAASLATLIQQNLTFNNPPQAVTSVADLAQASTSDWSHFFNNPPAGLTTAQLLPPFTGGGNNLARIAAFIRMVQQFFTVLPPAPPASFSAGAANAPATLALPSTDWLSQAISAYQTLSGTVVTLGNGFDPTLLASAAAQVFPDDAGAQAWLVNALTMLDALAALVNPLPIGGSDPAAVRFSIMEGLYARGLVSRAEIQALTLADFQAALTGTLAYDYASALYAAAGGTGGPPVPVPGPVTPVNPGNLVNCVPPPCRSPLGAIEYLHELLALAETASCVDPLAAPASGHGVLGDALATRRGPLAQLLASCANLEIPLPLIDIVNECLESLATTIPSPAQGAVYNTDGEHLAGYDLCHVECCPPDDADKERGCHDPAELYQTLPAWSSPAVPVALPQAYTLLASDFSAPDLPYSQVLDINRSYLVHLRSSRYALLRRFRREITSFVHDPALGAPTFQTQLWRYPLSDDLSAEYLCLSPQEAALFSADSKIQPWQLYGFAAKSDGDTVWTQVVGKVSEFLARTGLSYCELLALQQSGLVAFQARTSTDDQEGDGKLPDCEPCYPDRWQLDFGRANLSALTRLALYIRLWRKLQCREGVHLRFSDLADIVAVLMPAGGTPDTDFLRQLAALLLLCEVYHLPLIHPHEKTTGTGSARLHLLAFWVGPTDPKWDWALQQLLHGVGRHAGQQHRCDARAPQFIKLLHDNLDPLSRLAGFDPATAALTWHAQPTCTLRFAEVLAKLYASSFSVGEILYLFSAERHLDGNDDFPLQSANEAQDHPLSLPDDEAQVSLAQLRHRLLTLELHEKSERHWTWPRIVAALSEAFGYAPTGASDPLLELGRHFFPETLRAAGQAVTDADLRFSVPLTSANPAMWNSPHDGPFRYDSASQTLYTRIPLFDAAAIEKLAHLRQLNAGEQKAVQDLYHLPRLALAPFAFLFEDFAEAERRLIETPDESARWAWFQTQFAHAHARCHLIARHLAHHVGVVTGCPHEAHDKVAWEVLKSLFADENLALAPWENDAGTTPPVTWTPPPNGSAFAALLGLTGTGLLGEYQHGSHPLWREARGPLSAFDAEQNARNSPLPTILPPMDLTLSAQALQNLSLQNGYALNDRSGGLLGGAAGFSVRWSGVLLVEHGGDYHFLAGAPTRGDEAPDFERAEARHWRMVLKRGQRSWVVLNHRWPDQEEHQQPALSLETGAYGITIEFHQPAPDLGHCGEAVHAFDTGFQVKYRGPDTECGWAALPLARLFLDKKDATLAQGIAFPEGSQSKVFLASLYRSSLRDIRRTYQRAFKAMLFAARFHLSAERLSDDHQSELGYLLANPDLFAGVAYYLSGGAYVRHAAGFDFNLLPLLDNYMAPDATQDARVAPSLQRQQALFDWWERIFDYARMRAATRDARARPAWLLFHDAQQQQPADPVLLLRHIGVDLRYAEALLQVDDMTAGALYSISSADLQDDRWAVRVWHSDEWMRALCQHFDARAIGAARPALWATADPSVALSGVTQSGNANLTALVQQGEFDHGAPRRYLAIRRLNDCLRQRARDALVAYLTRNNRVPLPWGGFAASARDLSDLLLIDAEAGVCEKASRIDEAISAVQLFIRRARLGLEAGWQIDAAFARLWGQQFASFNLWQRCKLRVLYRENWMEWSEWARAERVEAFRLLTGQLRRRALSIAAPGGLEWWPDERPSEHPSLVEMQRREPAGLRRLIPEREGFGLQGLPERDGRLSWLAPLDGQAPPPPPPGNSVLGAASALAATPTLPYWLEAAVKPGQRFYRVAAAGEPLAGHAFAPRPHHGKTACCTCCDPIQPALTDEYYFWLEAGEHYSEPLVSNPPDTDPHDYQYGFQDDFYDSAAQQSSLWQDPTQLPSLLDWQPTPTVSLVWTRVHDGEFQPPRRSPHGVPVTTVAGADLVVLGRTDDSLAFSVSGAAALPPGYPAASFWGFRYDLAPDRAQVLPLVEPAAATGLTYPGGLPAYPFFLFGDPGAPLYPRSLYSPALAVAHTLRADCGFEAALKWLRQVFDPLQQDNTWVSCPNMTAPANPPTESAPSDTAPSDTADAVPAIHIGEPGAQGCCNSTGVSDSVARNRSILLNVLETLVQWADAELRRAAPQAFQQARLLLDTAARILGPQPPTILRADLPSGMTVGAFTPDFPPLNPRLLGLYQTVGDRLELIRCCENSRRLRNGVPGCDMRYFGDSPVREGWYPDLEVCVEEREGCYLPSPYRFEFLIAKAQQAAAKVRELGGGLLAAYEKGDAEYLADMRARFEQELLELNLAVRQDQWRDADWQIQALQKTKAISQSNLVYYTNLVNNGLIPNEVQYQDLTSTAMVTRAAGNIVEAVGEAIKIIPDLFVGFPCEEAQLPVGTKLAGVFESVARIIGVVADIENATAGLDLTNAGWDRRLADWIHQTQNLPIEIHQIELQILSAAQRRDQAKRELNAQQRQIEQSAETLNFLRDKFSADSLYLYLQRELNALYAESFRLARHVAHQAEHAYNLERGHTHRRFIANDEWNSFKEGLLAGERLDQELARMDQAWHDENRREYELGKHFSLRLHFPLAYLRLRATGRCEIELPEWMFDADYPGMYMRRIKSVSLTLPCIAGPYTGVHCRLTLLSSRTRIDPRAEPPVHRCCGDRHDCCDYDACCDDPRVVRQYAAREAIATSGGQNDSGLFELNFHDERYLPFEYHGAVSRWRIELPPENNNFDLDSLSDLILHLNYTAREGGEALRCAARECAGRYLPGDGWSLFEVKHEFPAAWARFRHGEDDCERDRDLDIDLHRNLFPWVPGGADLLLTEVAVLFETRECAPRAAHCVEWAWLRPPCHGDDIDYLSMDCVASAEWPCLYHGVHPIPAHCLAPCETQPTRLRFHTRGLCITRMFVLYRYRVEAGEECCFMPHEAHCECHRCKPCAPCR